MYVRSLLYKLTGFELTTVILTVVENCENVWMYQIYYKDIAWDHNANILFKNISGIRMKKNELSWCTGYMNL